MAKKDESKTKATTTEAKAEAPALDNNVRGKIDRSPGTPTPNELRSGLQGWASDQIAAGATTDEVKAALKDFDLEGSAVGVIEESKGSVGQWGVNTYPADWSPGEPAKA